MKVSEFFEEIVDKFENMERLTAFDNAKASSITMEYTHIKSGLIITVKVGRDKED